MAKQPKKAPRPTRRAPTEPIANALLERAREESPNTSGGSMHSTNATPAANAEPEQAPVGTPNPAPSAPARKRANDRR
jgi:hypothetical protein